MLSVGALTALGADGKPGHMGMGDSIASSEATLDLFWAPTHACTGTYILAHAHTHTHTTNEHINV